MKVTLQTKARRWLHPTGSMVSTLAVAAVAISLAGCNSRPGTTALDVNVPLKRDPTLSAGTVVWRSPDLARYEHMANTYYIPPPTVYRGSGTLYVGLDQQQPDRQP